MSPVIKSLKDLLYALHFDMCMFCVKEHHIIDRQIRDLAVRRDFAGVGQNERLFHVIVVVLYEGIQRAVDGVVLAGLDLNGNGGEAVVIVDQIIHLALAAVIVIERIVTVGNELAGDDALIDRAKVDAPFILQDRADIAAVQNGGQNTDVVQIKLQQVLAGGLDQWEGRRGDSLHVQRNAGADQVFKLVFIIGEGAAFFALNPLRHHALFLVLQVGGDLIVDPADLQLALCEASAA